MIEAPLPPPLGPWVPHTLLGRGGMATVYEATHKDTGEHCAIKLMNPGLVSREALSRFEREFRLLSGLHHPNIAEVYEAGSIDERPWFAMELLKGVDLRKVVEEWESPESAMPLPQRFALARSVLAQAAAALEYVHRRGLVHRDLTPGNLMLLPDGTIKLMDFGVVKGEDGDLTSHGEFLGTVAYVAPEQIQGHSVDGRADLYSLGAVLYFLLTGRKPFNARTLAGFLDKQLHQTPKPPHELVPEVPPILEDICQRLLQKEPSRRFPSATHLLAFLDDKGVLGAQPLVGREAEVQALIDRIVRCRDGRGGVLLITGANGMGKSRISKMSVEAARRMGMVAIRTHASASDLPLGAFARLFDALAAAGISGPRALAEAFRGGSMERHAVFSTYRSLLIGERGNPRVLVLDELNALDSSSWELLTYLIRNTTTLEDQAVLWVLTASDDERLERFVDTFHPFRLHLAPLPQEAVVDLVVTLLGESPATVSLAHRLHAESEGNQAFIQEMLRGLLEEGILSRDEKGRLHLELDETQVERSALPIPRSVRAALEARIRHLPVPLRTLMGVLAVAQLELSPGLLSDVMQLTVPEIEEQLETLVEHGLVRGHQTRFGLAQARLRELLLAELPESEQAVIHQQIGQALERRERNSLLSVLEPLAWHFEQGKLPGKGYAYLVRAGLSRLERSFMMDAAGYFGRALELEPLARTWLPLDEADRRLTEVLLSRARAFEHLGQVEEAIADLSRAHHLARDLQDERLLARAAGELGQQARLVGKLEEARTYAMEAQKLAESLGDASLRSAPLQVLAGVAWAQGDLDLARGHWQELLGVGELARDPKTTAFGYNGLGLAALCKGQTAEARRHFEQSASIFEQEGLWGPLATARGNLVEIHHFSGNLRRGLELAEKTRMQAREHHHPPGVARSLSYKAMLLTDLERHDEAIAAAEQGLALLCELGDPNEELFGRVMLIRACWAPRETERIADELDACAELVPQHDTEGFAPVLLAWRAQLLATSAPDQARRLLLEAESFPGGRWPYQECRLDLSLARGYAAVGDRAEATRRAEAAVRRADACGFRLYALKGHCLATLGTDEAAIARHRRIAEGLARSLAASLSREDAERFLAAPWLHPEEA